MRQLQGDSKVGLRNRGGVNFRDSALLPLGVLRLSLYLGGLFRSALLGSYSGRGSPWTSCSVAVLLKRIAPVLNL